MPSFVRINAQVPTSLALALVFIATFHLVYVHQHPIDFPHLCISVHSHVPPHLCTPCRELTTLWVARLDDGAELKVTDPKEQQGGVEEEEAKGKERRDGVD